MWIIKPPYIKKPKAVEILWNLLTIVVVEVINITPNKTTKKYILKFSNPGWTTKITPKKPMNNERYKYLLNFSFKKNKHK